MLTRAAGTFVDVWNENKNKKSSVNGYDVRLYFSSCVTTMCNTKTGHSLYILATHNVTFDSDQRGWVCCDEFDILFTILRGGGDNISIYTLPNVETGVFTDQTIAWLALCVVGHTYEFVFFVVS